MTSLLRWRDLLPTDGVRTSWHRDAQDLASWGDGPWVAEPDKVSWTDPATDRPCLVVRSRMGNLCGYAAVDPGHPLHGMRSGPAEVELEAHGGVNYANRCQPGPEGKVCHIPAPGKPHDVWWFGFDCAHLADLVPLMHGPLMASLGIPARSAPWYTYKSMVWVIGEVQQLAAQLATWRGAGIPA